MTNSKFSSPYADYAVVFVTEGKKIIKIITMSDLKKGLKENRKFAGTFSFF